VHRDFLITLYNPIRWCYSCAGLLCTELEWVAGCELPISIKEGEFFDTPAALLASRNRTAVLTENENGWHPEKIRMFLERRQKSVTRNGIRTPDRPCRGVVTFSKQEPLKQQRATNNFFQITPCSLHAKTFYTVSRTSYLEKCFFFFLNITELWKGWNHFRTVDVFCPRTETKATLRNQDTVLSHYTTDRPQ
jgi:hypothetical protein